MSESDETKFWAAITKLESVMADKFQELTSIQLRTERQLQELTVVVRDLATIAPA